MWADRIGNAKTDEVHPLAGASASVESSGTVRQRIGIARTALTGGIGAFFPKKIDDRRTYLTVEGPSFYWVFDLPSNTADAAARKFAAEVNNLARQVAPA